MTEKEKPSAGETPRGKTDILLPLCPVCGAGQVQRNVAGGKKHQFLCSHCASVIEENVLGFEYKTIDLRLPQQREPFSGKTFTLPELQELAQRRRATIEAKKAEEERLRAAAARVRAAQGKTEEEPKEEVLYWQVDEEALARRAQDEKKAKG